ncbi:hypothetical protein TELCIR_00282 [Teladorsagia circumcincta]|uniref:Uncharacterized protein n=1 Tax=Teladorsagia circumcincta TaxID=45464 RepID=A0A2G9V542_TELCI|nr:hypothetical protein TELCIR_00282 [Teladorsagia circumcincta]
MWDNCKAGTKILELHDIVAAVQIAEASKSQAILQDEESLENISASITSLTKWRAVEPPTALTT